MCKTCPAVRKHAQALPRVSVLRESLAGRPAVQTNVIVRSVRSWELEDPLALAENCGRMTGYSEVELLELFAIA
jgi:hypothetical protein